ncbi:fimbrial protein [Serratia sp. AKBS12]|uniref:fimbrial protein n=1 Tax=Serratia sp. AKBS12 TaxID=2974597 RepID=UPI0021654F15|nr:fimbrial protein [Serratia sp. AKBS12]MCS3406123.1 fimbrial protein [Serratia sp. AKBS12]
MRITLKRSAVLFLLFQVVQLHAAPRNTSSLNSIHLSGGTIRVNNRTQPLTLLKTVPINLYAFFGQNDKSVRIVTAPPLWDPQRGIYLSSIPGIGFSLCEQEGEECLVPGQDKPLTGAHYSVRLYATNEIHGGLYTPGTLMQLQSETSNVLLTMNNLRVDSMPCSFTAQRIDVKFPDVNLKSASRQLAEKSFSLPISCSNNDDYRNVLISFNYMGETYQGNTMRTNLKGIGINLKNSGNGQITLGDQASTPLNDNTFTAVLLRIPNEQPQAGNINISTTVTLTMR